MWKLTEPFVRTRDREGFVAFLRASRTVNYKHVGSMHRLAFLVFDAAARNIDPRLKLSTSRVRLSRAQACSSLRRL